MAVVRLAWSGRPTEGRGLVCCVLKLPSEDHYGGGDWLKLSVLSWAAGLGERGCAKAGAGTLEQ